MDINEKDINKNIRMMAAACGLSLAEVARRADDTPQGLNQRMKQGKMQSTLDYIEKIAAACGFVFEYRFTENDETK